MLKLDSSDEAYDKIYADYHYPFNAFAPIELTKNINYRNTKILSNDIQRVIT